MMGWSAAEPRFHVRGAPECGGRERWPPSILGAQKVLSLGWAHMTAPISPNIKDEQRRTDCQQGERGVVPMGQILLLLQQTTLRDSRDSDRSPRYQPLILNSAIWQIIKGCSTIVITEFAFPTFNSFQIMHLVIIITISFHQLCAKSLLTDIIFNL